MSRHFLQLSVVYFVRTYFNLNRVPQLFKWTRTGQTVFRKVMIVMEIQRQKQFWTIYFCGENCRQDRNDEAATIGRPEEKYGMRFTRIANVDGREAGRVARAKWDRLDQLVGRGCRAKRRGEFESWAMITLEIFTQRTIWVLEHLADLFTLFIPNLK